MEKRYEWAWCRHLRVQGAMRVTGGTVLMIDSPEPIRMYYMTEEVCAIICKSCYERENPVRPDLQGAHRTGDTSGKFD